MARLVIRSADFSNRVIDLHLGVNRLGRSPENDFRIDHSTVSARHCDLVLGNGEIIVRDCGSTNGTFVAGEQIQERKLFAGQTFCIGDVELFVESTEVTIAIPKFEMPQAAPPVVLDDGVIICPRHRHAHASHQCTNCRELLCDACVHRLRRRGGKVLKLCPLCSHPCELINGEKKRKRSLLGFLQKTVKLPFSHPRRKTEESIES